MGGVYGRTEEKRSKYGVLSERIESERETKWETEHTKSVQVYKGCKVD